MNCGSKKTFKNGKTRDQKQRYRCCDCGRVFVRVRNDLKRLRQRRWFKKYVEGYTLKQLVEISGLSKSTMCRIIGRELAEPVPDVSGLESVKYIIFDGKYLFGSKSCLLMVFDAQTRRPVAGRIAAREPKPQILPFLAELKTAGLNPFGVTTDGNQGAVAAFKAIWPEIIAQRCLFRIERQSLSWCRMRPRYLPALELKNIVYGLTLIKSREQADSFTKTFSDLKDKHENELSSYDTNHVVQSDILKAYAVVNNALENMFRYIDNPQIAQTTNNVESYFKQIQNIKGFRHNGLTKTHLTQLINWKIHYDTKPKNQSPKHKKSSPKNNT